MSDVFEHQPERFARAIRCGCEDAHDYNNCIYPKCGCTNIVRVAKAAIAEWDRQSPQEGATPHD
jgi:hypothetical protein